MKCDHCDICRRLEKCTPGRHVCWIYKNAEKDLKPGKWKAGGRK